MRRKKRRRSALFSSKRKGNRSAHRKGFEGPLSGSHLLSLVTEVQHSSLTVSSSYLISTPHVEVSVQLEEASESLKGLSEFMKETLGDRVEKVAISSRLSDSPCALVTSKFGWSAAQERIMKAQVSHQEAASCACKSPVCASGKAAMRVLPAQPSPVAISVVLFADSAAQPGIDWNACKHLSFFGPGQLLDAKWGGDLDIRGRRLWETLELQSTCGDAKCWSSTLTTPSYRLSTATMARTLRAPECAPFPACLPRQCSSDPACGTRDC